MLRKFLVHFVYVKLSEGLIEEFELAVLKVCDGQGFREEAENEGLFLFHLLSFMEHLE